ncbi:hypothetical protein [Campylobacter sp. MIT 99-7217]|nr:hypothetical protein [Campylobacter sp. MIT 99-7217]
MQKEAKTDKKYLEERKAVQKTMQKMQQELEKKEVMEVFKRLKDK